MHRSVLEFSFLKIKWSVSLWPKQHDVASHLAAHHPQHICVLIWRQRSMKHWRQENAAKFAVHRTQTRRGSLAGSVGLLCARNTLESSAQTAERKALHALCFLLFCTFQRCYCVKEVCCKRHVPKYLAQLRLWDVNSIAYWSVKKTLLLLCKGCVNA